MLSGLTPELLKQIRKDKVPGGKVELDEAKLPELQQLLRSFITNYSAHNLTIKSVDWSSMTNSTIDVFDRLAIVIQLSRVRLTEITLGGTLEGNGLDEQFTRLLQGLSKNTNITKFDIPLPAAFAEQAQRYVNRNKGLYLAHVFFIQELVKQYEPDQLGKRGGELEDIFQELKACLNGEMCLKEMQHKTELAYLDCPDANAEVKAALKAMREQFRQLEKRCIKSNSTPLMFAAQENFIEGAQLLMAHAAEVNVQNQFGYTALHYAAMYGHLRMVELLCENGAKKDIQSVTGKTPVDLALMKNYDDVIFYFNPEWSQKDKEKWIAKRNLQVGLGLSRFKFLPDNVDVKELGGGFGKEGFDILTLYLERFSKRADNVADARLKQIIENFQSALETTSLLPAEQFKKLEKEGLLLSVTGCKGHLMGFSIHKNKEGDYVLSLAERGRFAGRAKRGEEKDERKIPSIQSMVLPKDKVAEVLELLTSVAFKEGCKAEKLLFDELPEKTGSSWVYNEALRQTPFKAGICFFGNIKTLLLQEFVNDYGEEEGQKKYKEFSLFLRQELVKDYEHYSTNDDPYLAIAKESLKQKEEKHGNRLSD